MIRRVLLSFIIFLFSIYASFAQDEKAAIPLKLILEQMSSKYDIKFNYLEDEIVIFKIIPPESEWSLQTKIDYIKKETKLQFKVINQKYYNIYDDKKTDKPLCGFLIDSETGLPIENATIQISESNTSTTSNKKGYFELPKISSNTIEIKHISYQPEFINPKDLNNTDCPKIKLISIPQELNEVSVQQYLTSGISVKKDGSIIIKPNKFGILPGLIEPDVLQTMQQIPGIYSVDETASNISVRGGTNDQNLFLWNNIRIFQTSHFFGLISAFNPLIAHTVSITKNGTSAFFGESVSSTTNISSYSNKIEESQTILSADLISAEFYSKIKLSEKAIIKISGRRSLTDFFNSPTYENYSNRVFQNTVVTNFDNNEIVDYKSEDTFYFYDLTAQYQQKIGTKNELTFDAIAIQNSLDINQSSNLTSKNSNLNQQNFGGNLGWKTNWNENNSSQINISGSYYNLDATNESIQNNQILNQQNTVLDIEIQLKNSNLISDNYTLNTGLQYDELAVTNFDAINTPEYSRENKEVSRTYTAVAEGIFQSKNNNTFLNTGLRLNYFEKLNIFNIEPRLQFNQSLTKTLQLEILGEQKSQTLSQIIDLQQDFLGLENKRWVLANDQNIPIEKSNQIALGFIFKKNNWLITLDNFYKSISGITSESQGFQNQIEFINTIGNYEVLGSEILIQKKINQFYTWISYTYNENNYLFNEIYNAQFANNYEIEHTLFWAGVYDWKKTKIALGTKWHTGKPYTQPETNALNLENPSNPKINYTQPNKNNLPDYFQLNFSASRNWDLNKKTNFEVSLSILNVLNTRNVINRFYRVNLSDKSVEIVDTYSLERTPNINFKITF